MKVKNTYLEAAIITVFIAAFLYVGMGQPWQAKLNWESPYGYFASDSFLHQVTAQYMKDADQIKYAAPYANGGYTDIYDIHPPFLFELTAVFSDTSGIEVFNVIYFIVIIFALLTALTMYVIIRRYNKHIALFALPLALHIFTGNFTQLFTFGQFLFMAGTLMMVAMFWAMIRLEMKYSYIFIGIFMAGTALGHQAETIIGSLFVVLYLVYLIIKKQLDVKNVKTIALAVVVTLVFSLFSLIIFIKGWLSRGDSAPLFTADTMKYITGRNFKFIGFGDLGVHGWIGWVILLGIVLLLLNSIRKKDIPKPALVAGFMLLTTYLLFLGDSKRWFAHRWLWYIYLGFFFGYVLYVIAKTVYKQWNITFTAGIALLLVIILTITAKGQMPQYPGLISKESWDSLQWSKENIPPNSDIFYFYDDSLTQAAAFYNSGSLTYRINRDKFIESLQQGALLPEYNFRIALAYRTYVCKRSGIFSYGYFYSSIPVENQQCEKEWQPLTYEEDTRSLCSLEYMRFAKTSRQPILAQANIQLMNILLANEWIKEIYSNPSVSILHNEKLGEACFNVEQ